MKFKEYLIEEKVKEDISLLYEGYMFFESEELLTEGFADMVKKALPKLGFHVDAGGQGLIQQLKRSGETMSQLFWYASKAWWSNDKEAKEKVKELTSTEITKEDLLKFVLNLDKLTLHLITGPLKIIDALTGWHIDANVGKAVDDVVKRAKVAIENLKIVAKNAEDKVKQNVIKFIHALNRIFGFPQEKVV